MSLNELARLWRDRSPLQHRVILWNLERQERGHSPASRNGHDH